MIWSTTAGMKCGYAPAPMKQDCCAAVFCAASASRRARTSNSESPGLRFGEVVNLLWKHIDFENGFVTLEKTKNGDIRVVPLPDQIAAYLQGLPRMKCPDEFVFPSKNPAKRYQYSLIRKAFQKAVQDTGSQDFKFHDLRHTAASHMAMNGATQGELMEVLGHRSPVMTRRYAHFSKEHIARILQKTSNNLIGPSGENCKGAQ